MNTFNLLTILQMKNYFSIYLSNTNVMPLCLHDDENYATAGYSITLLCILLIYLIGMFV